jgi:Tol biopolymer transport system component
LDFPFTDNVPVNIIHDASINYPISWSPDGYYLAYGSVHDDGKTLLIWNREISSPIHHYQEQISSLAWSSDGRLAFTEFYKFSSLDEGEDWNEVFIWEGDTAVNLSQNPSGEDRFPAWSADGRLAFLSERDSKHDIFVWDGTSKIDGVPDVNTFVKIAPNLTGYYSSPAWTNSDSLTFTGSGDSYLQIYEWDGRRATNISKNPGFHSGSPRWRSDGYWSFSNGIMSSQSLLHIRNEKNKTQLTVEKGVSSAWGQSGHLMICIRSSPTWTLSMWNGVEIIEITEGYNIDASWRNGEDVFCTSG